MIRLGIIGTGMIWEKSHQTVLRHLNQFSVDALCVRNPDKAARYHNEYPAAKIYSDMDVLLQDSNIDAVLIATPIPLNASTAIKALSCGKDVFIEKPLATSASEAFLVQKTAEKCGRKLFILEQYVYDNKIDILKSLIHEKALGNLVTYEKVTHFIMNPFEKDSFGQVAWRHNPQFPLGTLLDSGMHDIAILTKIFGKPQCVWAHGMKFQGILGDYDHVFSTYVYADGFSGTHSFSASLEGHLNRFILHFTKGSIVSDDTQIRVYPLGKNVKIIPFRPEDSFRRMWLSLADAYSQNIEAPFCVSDAIIGIQMLDAVAQSLESSKPQII